MASHHTSYTSFLLRHAKKAHTTHQAPTHHTPHTTHHTPHTTHHTPHTTRASTDPTQAQHLPHPPHTHLLSSDGGREGGQLSEHDPLGRVELLSRRGVPIPGAAPTAQALLHASCTARPVLCCLLLQAGNLARHRRRAGKQGEERALSAQPTAYFVPSELENGCAGGAVPCAESSPPPPTLGWAHHTHAPAI